MKIVAIGGGPAALYVSSLRKQADRAHDYGPRGKMLLDTDENRYLIPDVQALPERDRRLLLRHIYW